MRQLLRSWFGLTPGPVRTAQEFYGRVVAAARQPAFYRDWGIPDTVEGRYEMVALHLFLALEALKARPDEAARLSQPVIEAFVTDMDDCMREMGVGDTVVPKKVKRAAAAFYERSGAYRAGLADGAAPEALAAALTRHAYGVAGASTAPAHAEMLAGYMRKAYTRLRGQDAASMFQQASN